MHLTQQAVHYNHSLSNHYNLLSTTRSHRDWYIIDDAVSKLFNQKAGENNQALTASPTTDSEMYENFCRTPEQLSENQKQAVKLANGKAIEKARFPPKEYNMSKFINNSGVLSSILTELEFQTNKKMEPNTFPEHIKSEQRLRSATSYPNKSTPDNEYNEKTFNNALRLSELLHTPMSHNIPATLSPHSVTKTANYANSNRRSKQFQRTKICPYYIKGFCANQDRCSYAHHLEELQPLPDLKKTKLCCSIKRGKNCYLQDCTYAHSIQELKPPPDLDTYKTSFCFFWKKSKCFNGSKCRFAHGEHELRSKKNDAGICVPNAIPAEQTSSFIEESSKKFVPLNSLQNLKKSLFSVPKQHSSETELNECDLDVAQNIRPMRSQPPRLNDHNFSYDAPEKDLTPLHDLQEYNSHTVPIINILNDEKKKLSQCDSEQHQSNKKDQAWIHFQPEKFYMDKNTKNDESLNCLVENILSNLNQLVIQSNN